MSIDTAVIGIAQTAGLAGVIVGFCELGALLLHVPNPPVALGRASRPTVFALSSVAPAKYVAGLRQGQCSQIGGDGIQRDDFCCGTN